MFENIRVALNAKYTVQGIKRRYQTECSVLTVWNGKAKARHRI